MSVNRRGFLRGLLTSVAAVVAAPVVKAMATVPLKETTVQMLGVDPGVKAGSLVQWVPISNYSGKSMMQLYTLARNFEDRVKSGKLVYLNLEHSPQQYKELAKRLKVLAKESNHPIVLTNKVRSNLPTGRAGFDPEIQSVGRCLRGPSSTVVETLDYASIERRMIERQKVKNAMWPYLYGREGKLKDFVHDRTTELSQDTHYCGCPMCRVGVPIKRKFTQGINLDTSKPAVIVVNGDKCHTI